MRVSPWPFSVLLITDVSCLTRVKGLYRLREFSVHPVVLGLLWVGLSVAGERRGQARFVTCLGEK